VTERDALLAAIRAHPDEDTPRLVFADWLDENEPDPKPRAKKGGAPSSWAALIRAECELARLQDDGSGAAAVYRFFCEKDDLSVDGVRWARVDPDVAHRIELKKRADRARGPSKKARNLGRPKGNVGGSWDDDTHRGFPLGMHHVGGESLLVALPALTEYCPPVSITAYATDLGPSARELVEGGLGRWCRNLTIILDPPGNADLFHALVAHPDAATLRALTVGLPEDAATANRALAALADSRHLSGLRALTLTATVPVPAELVTRVARSKLLRGLTRLHLNGTVAEVALQMADVGNCPALRQLALCNSHLTDDDAILLAAAPGLKELRFLDLQENQIGGAGASALLASPHLANLAVLDLDDNAVRGLDAAALARAPAGGLRVLAFHGSRLTLRDVTALMNSPRIADLMYFDADENRLPASALPRLIRGFGDRPPAVLYFTGNSLSDESVEALTSWPAAARIDRLHLMECRMSTRAAKAIAGCAHLKGLTHLCATPTHEAGRAALRARYGARASIHY
jgi:uncharacterized protein (TIGR02996 family)